MPARLIATGALACWAWPQGALAHHVMDYATPATALDGFLSGIGHPVIGLDHLLFVIGAGVLAARVAGGRLLPLLFVATSVLAVGARYLAAGAAPDELWVAGSLVALALVMLVSVSARRDLVAGLFLVAGAIHGLALGEGVVGAEPTPLYAYLTGLSLVLCAVAYAALGATLAALRARPGLPLTRVAGAAVGVAGIAFVAAALG
jgi:urease accessory protein